MSTFHSHHRPSVGVKRKRVGSGQDATLKRTFCLWVLVGSCLFMIAHQVQLTKKAVRQSRNTKEPTTAFFLPDITGVFFDDSNNNVGSDDVFADDDNAHRYDDDDDSVAGTDDYYQSQSGNDSTDSEQQQEEDEDANDPLSVDAYVKRMRQRMDETVKQNGGKVKAKQYMDMYQKAIERRRKKRAEAKIGNGKYSQYAGGGLMNPQDAYSTATRSTWKEGREAVRDKFRTAKEKHRDMQKEKPKEERKTRSRRRKNYRTREDWRPPNLTADFTKLPPLPMENKILPSMKDAGGVIFFLHVPKTGGQTIRQFNLRFRMHLERKTLLNRRKEWKEKHPDAPMHRGLKRTKAAIAAGADMGPMKGEQPPTPELMELDLLSKQRLRFVIANKLEVFHTQAVPQVNHYLESPGNTRGKILFVEVHGMDNYQAFELEPYIQYWRQQSKKSGVPFFAFTLLREALSLHVSFFNYYYIHPGDPRFCKNPLKPQQQCNGGYMSRREQRQKRRDEARSQYAKMRGMGDIRGGEDEFSLREFMKQHYVTNRGGGRHANGMKDVSHEDMEKAMLQVAYNNPQCLFLSRGERTFGDGTEEKRLRDVELKRTECQQVYLSLQRTMDWIGRTDTLSTETLPMLTHIMFDRPELGKHLPKANVSPPTGFVKFSKLQVSTAKALAKLSQFDMEIYHRIKEDYTMDQWVNKTDYDEVALPQQ